MGTLEQVVDLVLTHADLLVLPAGARLPRAMVVPAGTSPLSRHGLQVDKDVALVTEEYVPIGQGVQTNAPVVAMYVPAAQLSQLSTAEAVQVARYFPTPHNCRGGSVNRKWSEHVKGNRHQWHWGSNTSNKTTNGQGCGSSPCTSSHQYP